MPTFDYAFVVDAPLAAVSAFHQSTDILKRLTPPPMFAQIHDFGEMREGMVARFTLWLGPIPLRWQARHVDVGPNGFTDVQERGPLAAWRHTHHFSAESPTRTRIHEHIEYTHRPGLPGLFTRLIFGRIGLHALFTYRQLVTRRTLRRTQPA